MGRKSYGINMLPAGTADEQRERGQLHTAYETETAFYSCIRAGDVQGVEKMMWECLKAGVFVGRMSTDALTQTKYFAVCCVAVACRYAIAGGMDETDAYLYSDDCIMRVDKMTDPEEIGFRRARCRKRNGGALSARRAPRRQLCQQASARAYHAGRNRGVLRIVGRVSFGVVQEKRGVQSFPLCGAAQTRGGQGHAPRRLFRGRSGVRAGLLVREPFHKPLRRGIRLHSGGVGGAGEKKGSFARERMSKPRQAAADVV